MTLFWTLALMIISMITIAGAEYRSITYKDCNREVKTLEASVRARLAGVSVPFNLEEPDACQNSNITCPLQAGEIYYYSQTVHILDNYPKVSVHVNWLLNDPSNDETETEHKREVCAIFMAKVVDPAEIN